MGSADLSDLGADFLFCVTPLSLRYWRLISRCAILIGKDLQFTSLRCFHCTILDMRRYSFPAQSVLNSFSKSDDHIRGFSSSCAPSRVLMVINGLCDICKILHPKFLTVHLHFSWNHLDRHRVLSKPSDSILALPREDCGECTSCIFFDAVWLLRTFSEDCE